MIPLFATIGLSKLVVESKQSPLEKGESTTGKLSTLLREMQHGIENVLVETVDDPAVGEATPTPAMFSTASSSDTLQQSRSSSPTLPTNPSPPPAATAPGLQPGLLLVQLAIVASLNKLPPYACRRSPKFLALVKYSWDTQMSAEHRQPIGNSLRETGCQRPFSEGYGRFKSAPLKRNMEEPQARVGAWERNILRKNEK